jgi:hypothetical protein
MGFFAPDFGSEIRMQLRTNIVHSVQDMHGALTSAGMTGIPTLRANGVGSNNSMPFPQRPWL